MVNMKYNKFITESIQQVKDKDDENNQIQELKEIIKNNKFSKRKIERLSAFVDYRGQYMNAMSHATIFFAVISGTLALTNIVDNVLYDIFILILILIFGTYTYGNIKKCSDTKTLLMKIAIKELKEDTSTIVQFNSKGDKYMKTVTLHFKEEWINYVLTEDEATLINTYLLDDTKETFSFVTIDGTNVWVNKSSLDTVIIEEQDETE